MKFSGIFFLVLLLALISLSAQSCVKVRVQLETPRHKTPVIKVCEGSLLLLNPCRLKILYASGP